MLGLPKNNVGTALSGLLLCMMLLSQGCIFMVPIIVAYYSDGSVTVTVEVPKSAPEVFEAAKKRVAMKGSELGVPFEVINVDEDDYSIDVEGADHSWRANFAVVPISRDVSQIVAHGTDDNREKEESEHLVLIGIKGLCDDLGVKYTVVGEHGKES